MVPNNICGGRALGIAVGITALAILLLAGSASALSNSGGGSWSYNKNIIITNTGDALTEYQVLVNLDGNNFPSNARPDGADTRFTDTDGNELSYWIESWDYAGRGAKIWVKVPSIAGGGSAAVRMYYGNPSAGSASRGDATFVFFDDFNRANGSIGNGWTVVQGSVKIDTNKARLATDAVKDPWAYRDGDNNGISIQNDFHIASGSAYRAYGTMVRAPTSGLWYTGYGWLYIQQTNTLYIYDNGGAVASASLILPVDTWLTGEMIIKSDDSLEVRLWQKESSRPSSPSITYNGPPNSAGSMHKITAGGDYNTLRGYVDNFFVRKYASPEPSVSVGAEVSNVAENFKIAHITDVHIGYYPGREYCIDTLFASIQCSPQYMVTSAIRFTDTLQAVKENHPSFILITGDLVQYDNSDFFKAFRNLLKGINIPVYTTLGNHDRRNVILGDNILNYNNYIKPISNPSSVDNNYSFDYKGYRFIGLDSGADYHKDPTSPEATGLSDDQIRRLKDEFNNSYPKIIFMHHPVMSWENDSSLTLSGRTLAGVPHDGAPGGNNGAIAVNRWNFINYTRDSNVQLVLTGHNHNDSIFNLTGNSVDNSSLNRPLFIQTRSATMDENGGPGYRLIDVNNGVYPYNTVSPPRYIRNSGEFRVWGPDNKKEVNSRLGLHAFNFSGEHTGMITGCDDFELGIQDSYYTGDYGGSFTPQVIISYSPINEAKVYSCKKPNVVNSITNAQSLATIQNVPSLEPVFFNLTLEKQREISTTEITFNSINVTESSIATVNVSDPITSYKMEIDLNGDGITDKTINPDSIDTILAQPQKNIDVIAYNGAGTINLLTGSGNFIKASGLKPLLLTGKPPYKFPYGIFGFNISGLNSGQTIGITITLPRNISSAAQYWKYGSTPDTPLPHWYQIPLGSNDGDNVITIQLQDGGVGDDDLTANGIILDAGGPAIPIVGKVTGEGWIVSPVTPVRKNNNKATFEFAASYVNGKPDGRIEFTDHAADVKIHGNVTTLSVDKEANTATFSGLAEINGAKYTYTVTAVDNGEHGKTDALSINIPAINYISSGILGGGNIQIHKDKIEEKDEIERD
ncbi:MAG: DUF2341 domain-containing protein [Candidatus Methanoperedens sp.]|nr:DUF2341 domain-containing protein [Candidatus Methanoperedens sp.]